jgi:hypothetical protein
MSLQKSTPLNNNYSLTSKLSLMSVSTKLAFLLSIFSTTLWGISSGNEIVYIKCIWRHKERTKFIPHGVDFYSASWLIQQSEGRHVTPCRHIISQKVDMSLQVDTLLVKKYTLRYIIRQRNCIHQMYMKT